MRSKSGNQGSYDGHDMLYSGTPQSTGNCGSDAQQGSYNGRSMHMPLSPGSRSRYPMQGPHRQQQQRSSHMTPGLGRGDVSGSYRRGIMQASYSQPAPPGRPRSREVAAEFLDYGLQQQQQQHISEQRQPGSRQVLPAAAAAAAAEAAAPAGITRPSVTPVSRLLAQLGLGEYAPRFAKELVETIDTLSQLVREDYVDMEIPKGVAVQIMAACKARQGSGADGLHRQPIL
jgi:hypothetical protein